MTDSQSPAFVAAITAFHAPHSADTCGVVCPTLDDDRAGITMGTCDVVLGKLLGTMQTASHADVVCHDTKNTTLAIMCAAQ